MFAQDRRFYGFWHKACAYENKKPPKRWPRMLVAQLIGGQGEIRTHDTLARIPDFESGAFDHSATCPLFCYVFNGKLAILTRNYNFCLRGGIVGFVWAKQPKLARGVLHYGIVSGKGRS